MSEYTSSSPSLSGPYIQETAKSMLAKLHAQHYLDRPQGQQSGRLKRSERRKSLSKLFKCLVSQPVKLDIILYKYRKRRHTEASFQNELMANYRPRHPTKDQLWCPIFGKWVSDGGLESVHIFDSMHGEDTMKTIFGNSYWRYDLYSAQNGLLVHRRIAEAFDSGKFVIVPENTKQPGVCVRLDRICGRPQEYKLHIIDPTWNQLDGRIQLDIDITWRDLDGKRLIFRSGYRPKVQYVYFHYCLQILRRVWQYKRLSTIVLDEELNKNLWKLPGSFLPRNMLLAFVKELGPGYENLLQGSNNRNGQSEDPFMLLNVCAWQIFGWQCRSLSSDGDDTGSSSIYSEDM